MLTLRAVAALRRDKCMTAVKLSSDIFARRFPLDPPQYKEVVALDCPGEISLRGSEPPDINFDVDVDDEDLVAGSSKLPFDA